MRYLSLFAYETENETTPRVISFAEDNWQGDNLSNHAPAETRTDDSAVREEQEHLSLLYRKLDNLREQALHRRARALRESGGTHQARYERDTTVNRLTDQIAQFDAVEEGLCFGRLDYHDESVRRIGRIGIFDDNQDYEPLLLDWRAPAARPFYTATAVSPEGVRRRRHVRTRGRSVVEINDEVLDLTTARPEGLTGEAALLAAVNAGRTGRMRDIVETIQAEQDRVIRSGLNGVLVVQGGPGTGKTVTASPAATRVPPATMDGTARVWDAASGEELATLTGLPARTDPRLRERHYGRWQGLTMTEIMRTGLSLASLAMTEARRDNSLAVTNASGEVLKQVILPK